MPKLTLNEFISHLEQATRKAGYEVEKREGAVLHIIMHNGPFRCDLKQLYQVYRQNPDRLNNVTEVHLSALQRAAKASRLPTEEEAARALLPMLNQRKWLRRMPKKAPPIHRPFLARLIISYVFDFPAYRAYINDEMLAPVLGDGKRPFGEVHEYALENLRQRTSHRDYEIHGVHDEKLIVCQKKDGYAATRVLLPDLMEKWTKQFPGAKMLIGIPNRDFLIAFSNRNPMHVATIGKQVRKDARWRDHSLSKELFVWEDGELREYRAKK
ncbi:MAG: DUF1444 family protein [Anaerolineales bacterium]